MLAYSTYWAWHTRQSETEKVDDWVLRIYNGGGCCHQDLRRA